MDLGSKGGTYLKDEGLTHLVPYQLKTGDLLNFSLSTRQYKVELDYSKVE